MPESSFTSANQVTAVETRSGRFLTESLLRRIVARDVELIDLMERGGPPSSTPAISAIQKQGDLTYTTNTTIGGIIYCDSFAINPGVTVTIDRFLILVCRGAVTIHGHLDADGKGIQPSALQEPPLPGITAGGGGGGGDSTDGIDGSAGIATAGGLGGVGQNGNGGNAAAMSAMEISIGFVQRNAYLLIGGGAGGNGGMSTGPYPSKKGGAGGGYIEIRCRELIVSANGLISARGKPGADEYDYRWAASGGGGGGIAYIRCVSCNGAERISAGGGAGGIGKVSGAPSGGNGADGIKQIEIYA